MAASPFVWNTRDDREPWAASLSKIIGNETVESKDGEEPISASGLFGSVERMSFEFVPRVDRETLVDLVRSHSYCAGMEPEERDDVITRVGALYDANADADGLDLPYVTECFRAVRL